jgi:hypothetical protein
MDIANRFADGEDACNNKRTRSPEDDRGNRYGGQRRRSRNYDNYGSYSQVAAGYKDNSYQENGRKSSGYRSYGKEDYKKFQTKESREYNPSPEDMLNGPCHIHSAFVDGKRVSRHAMKDCTTFLKLQEAALNNQAEAKWQGYEGNTSNAPANQQGNNGVPQGQDQPNQGRDDDGGYAPSKGHITAMIQPVPKSNKEEKNKTRQVNLAVTSPPATTEYLHWSEQPIEFSRDDHPITVPRPGNVPLVLKAQIGTYDVDRVFMDAGSGINLIYTKTLLAITISCDPRVTRVFAIHGSTSLHIPGTKNARTQWNYHSQRKLQAVRSMRQGISQDSPKLRRDGKLQRTQLQSKKCDYRSHTATRRTPSRARSEETAGTAVRTRETYTRRREDSRDIGDKKNKK